MARGFVTGVLWGIVAAGAGLAVLSQMAPPPKPTPPVETTPIAQPDPQPAEKAPSDQAPSDQAASDQAAADKAAAEKAAIDKAAAEQAIADKAAADKAAAEQAIADKAAADKAAAEQAIADKAAADKAAADTAAAEKAAQAETARLAAQQQAAEQAQAAATPPEAAAEAPPATAATPPSVQPGAPAADTSVPSLTNLDQALTAPVAEPTPSAAEPAPSAPEGPKDALLVPGQPADQPEPARLPQIAPVADPEVAALPPEALPPPAADTVPANSPAATLQDNQPTLPPAKPLQDKVPTTVLDKSVFGVTTDQLPQIGATPKAADAAAAEATPIQAFARKFDGASGRPLFVIMLHDVGAAGMSREELAKLPFPVSFVIDPLATDAKEASAAYRAAGQEVLTLANGIPRGATAEDLETTFQTLSGILPESVAVVDQDIGGFQDQRALATLVLPVIKGEGRGLVTYDRGLNAADQIARRSGVPATVIFRRLDSEAENKPTIRRYLDRAAFKAAQDGYVVVIGDTRAETVAAILEWTVEGKAGTVALAPVTAVLGR